MEKAKRVRKSPRREYLLMKRDTETGIFERIEVFSIDEPIGHIAKSFASEETALKAAGADPEFCEKNDVRVIRVSPRILPKKYQPRKVRMVFGAGQGEGA